MPDAVLVMNASKNQELKSAVETLKKLKIQQAEQFPTDHRPWGWFEILITSDQFQVKKISVFPGKSLSLQSHQYRSEHWVVVEGTATVTIDKDVSNICSGQSVYIQKGAVHRLQNKTESLLVLIEVQLGSYLGEDDIVRYQDEYSRL